MAGVVSAGSKQTAEAGAAILAQGGNAIDAAVAAAFASFIAEIGVVHLGGSGIAHIYDPSNGRSLVYDFFSNMPGLAPPGLRQAPPAKMDFSEVSIDFGATTQPFHLGRASVAVPGNIAGLCQMAADYGRLPLATLLQPAIDLAQNPIHLEPFQTATCRLLAPLYTNTPAMKAIFAPSGQMIQPNEPFYIPHLADTLRELAEAGSELAKNGRLAQAILQDQATNGGLLTPTDLEQYEVRKLPSIQLRYREYDLLLPPPSSTGGVLTAFTLKLLSTFNIRQLTHGSARHLQLLYEIMTATTRAREQWDSWSETLPTAEAIDRFLADDFIGDYQAIIRHNLAQNLPGRPTPEKRGPSNTSHLSVVDSDGLAVSLTTTAGESAGYIVPGTGYIPNNMLGEADLHPRGFHIRPAGQRIPTMMAPTIVLADGQTRMVVGSGGSIRIRSAILQAMSNLLDYGMTLNKAINSSRVHVEDGVLQCEAGFDETAVSELEAMGYPVNRWQTRSIYFGGAHSVSRTKDGRLVAVGDNRRGGAVATG